jgi:NAD(P)-dependent dehydrogenase (short-subunit alcohol dehydrogenase family)/uncharacterized protein YndB with AHSA1/START domain
MRRSGASVTIQLVPSTPAPQQSSGGPEHFHWSDHIQLLDRRQHQKNDALAAHAGRIAIAPRADHNGSLVSLAGIVGGVSGNGRRVQSTIRRMSLQQHIVVVTGGGRGLGRAMAQTFASAGSSVVVFARSDAEIRETISLIRDAGGVADGWPLDITDARAVTMAVERVRADMGAIDLLVNNAAIAGPIGPCWESSPEDWWRTIDVNVRGALLCTHSVVGSMIARRRGRIINVVSGALPVAYFSAYMTSKSALIRFTECLAIEAKPFGISAFAMAPGTVRTALSEHSLSSAEGQRWLPWFRRMFDEGLDLPVERPARLALALASGDYDELSGLSVTPFDDLDAMRAALAEIDREKLYSLRVRTLPTSGSSAIAAARQAAEQPRDLAIRIERAFPVGPDVVFEAWTDSAAIAVWFLPSTDARWIDPPISDPRPDGMLNLLAEVRGERYHLFGRYRTVVPLRALSLDWSWRDLPIIDGAGHTTLNVRFEPSSGGCLVVLGHTGFQTIQARNAHERAWARCFDRLAALFMRRSE